MTGHIFIFEQEGSKESPVLEFILDSKLRIGFLNRHVTSSLDWNREIKKIASFLMIATETYYKEIRRILKNLRRAKKRSHFSSSNSSSANFNNLKKKTIEFHTFVHDNIWRLGRVILKCKKTPFKKFIYF